MAIRLLGPALQGAFTHILSKDPALDTEAEGFADAWQTYREHGIAPPMKAGEEPSVFRLELVTDVELIAEMLDLVEGLNMRYAVEVGSFSIRSVDNLKDKDGNDLKLRHEMVNGHKKLCKEQRDLLGKDILAELGYVCIGKQSPS